MVWVLGAVYEPVGTNGYAADDDEANIMIVQGFEQGAKVEFDQRAAAAPLMALICLQRA
jgi:hypothetical protein